MDENASANLGSPARKSSDDRFNKKELKEKVKIISSPYPSKNNPTQRVYLEIDLDNKNYRKLPTQTNDSKTEKSQFDESNFFEEIRKRIDSSS